KMTPKEGEVEGQRYLRELIGAIVRKRPHKEARSVELLSELITSLKQDGIAVDPSGRIQVSSDSGEKAMDALDSVSIPVYEGTLSPGASRGDAGSNGSLLTISGNGQYELITPLVGFKPRIEKKLAQFPFDKNVFLMMKFRDTNKALSDFIIENLQ